MYDTPRSLQKIPSGVRSSLEVTDAHSTPDILVGTRVFLGLWKNRGIGVSLPVSRIDLALAWFLMKFVSLWRW